MSEREQIREEILQRVGRFVHAKKEESDWISYSGPVYDEREYIAAIDSLLDGWLVFGEKARKFEKTFPEHLGKMYGTYVNSGSSANLLMAAAAKKRHGWADGAGIITPVVCFPTTLAPIIQNDLYPIFVDVTLPSANLDLNQVEKVLETQNNIVAIMFAHVLGNPPDMDKLMWLVHKHNLVLLEDTCDALGSTYKNKKLGSYGDISTCSFFPAHHMTTGEGGIVATNDERTAKLLTSLRDWGRACFCNSVKPGCVVEGTACGDRFRNWLPGMPDVTYDHRYVFDNIGYNLKPLELQGAIGLEQMKKLPYLDSCRRANFQRLSEIFQPYKDFFHLPVAEKLSDPCWFAYLVTVKETAPFTREDIVQFLEDHKIQTRHYFAGNIIAHPGYYHLRSATKYPVADLITTNSFFLGTFAGIDEQKLDRIEQVVSAFMSTV